MHLYRKKTIKRKNINLLRTTMLTKSRHILFVICRIKYNKKNLTLERKKMSFLFVLAASTCYCSAREVWRPAAAIKILHLPATCFITSSVFLPPLLQRSSAPERVCLVSRSSSCFRRVFRHPAAPIFDWTPTIRSVRVGGDLFCTGSQFRLAAPSTLWQLKIVKSQAPPSTGALFCFDATRKLF